MLIEQIIGAACAQLVKRTLRLGAAEPRAIGDGLLLRPLSCRALLELFQIDQIPHAGPRHAGSVVVATMQSIDGGVQISVELAAAKLGGYALVSSILIMKFPIMRPIASNTVLRFIFEIILLYHGEAPR
jgi:hypothetical protein